mmetsp:Transcript_2022/g.5926  ORF Transcript_2022/g.5926 Transcript_2022/m.5926 type:complete len:248 (-) Transcript_2022:134-877(-)
MFRLASKQKGRHPSSAARFGFTAVQPLSSWSLSSFSKAKRRKTSLSVSDSGSDWPSPSSPPWRCTLGRSGRRCRHSASFSSAYWLKAVARRMPTWKWLVPPEPPPPKPHSSHICPRRLNSSLGFTPENASWYFFQPLHASRGELPSEAQNRTYLKNACWLSSPGRSHTKKRLHSDSPSSPAQSTNCACGSDTTRRWCLQQGSDGFPAAPLPAAFRAGPLACGTTMVHTAGTPTSASFERAGTGMTLP